VNELLEARGWALLPGEPCWLDCTVMPAYLKRWHHSEIVLCAPHAERLEDGYMGGSYSGAPLPADSMASEWPWQRIPVRVVEVV
jgi:hypothetical protein